MLTSSTLMVSLVMSASSCFCISCRFQLLKTVDFSQHTREGSVDPLDLLVVHLGYELCLSLHQMKYTERYDDQQNMRVLRIQVDVGRGTACKDEVELEDHQYGVADGDATSHEGLYNKGYAGKKKSGANHQGHAVRKDLRRKGNSYKTRLS